MKSYESGCTCSWEEYQEGRPQRINGPELQVDELYTVMTGLKQNKHHHEAAKLSAKIDQKRIKDGLCLAKVVFLDSDFRPKLDFNATIRNGFWVNVSEKLIVAICSNNEEVCVLATEAYFKTYEDPGDFDFDLLNAALDIPVISQPHHSPAYA